MADNNGTPLPAGAPYDRGEQLKMWLGGEAELPPGAPYNRDEQLVMWLGDEAELPPGAPYNRDEQLTMWLKDHIGGGGNPNYVETIEGTLANPFGDYNITDLTVFANVDNSVNMYMLADGAAVGLGAYPLSWLKPLRDSDFGILFFGASYLPQSGNNLVADVQYTSTGLSLARIMMGDTITDMKPYAEMITTTLTIIHHPLPDTP